MTIEIRFRSVTSFYKYNDVVYQPIERAYIKPTTLAANNGIPTKEEIHEILKVCEPLEKAIVLVGASVACDGADNDYKFDKTVDEVADEFDEAVDETVDEAADEFDEAVYEAIDEIKEFRFYSESVPVKVEDPTQARVKYIVHDLRENYYEEIYGINYEDVVLGVILKVIYEIRIVNPVMEYNCDITDFTKQLRGDKYLSHLRDIYKVHNLACEIYSEGESIEVF